jgi:hypothetical protein
MWKWCGSTSPISRGYYNKARFRKTEIKIFIMTLQNRDITFAWIILWKLTTLTHYILVKIRNFLSVSDSVDIWNPSLPQDLTILKISVTLGFSDQGFGHWTSWLTHCLTVLPSGRKKILTVYGCLDVDLQDKRLSKKVFCVVSNKMQIFLNFWKCNYSICLTFRAGKLDPNVAYEDKIVVKFIFCTRTIQQTNFVNKRCRLYIYR